MKKTIGIVIIILIIGAFIGVNFAESQIGSKHGFNFITKQYENTENYYMLSYENYHNTKIDGSTLQKPITTLGLTIQNASIETPIYGSSQYVSDQFRYAIESSYNVIKGPWKVFDELRVGINTILQPVILTYNMAQLGIEGATRLFSTIYNLIANIWE